MIYFDFKEAFYCVPRLRMLHKLNELGICGRLHNWKQRFLTKRTLRVKVGEEYSKCIDVTSGVPQGSVLGPVLFLLYINDCLNGLPCDAVMFADEVKIWRTIESPSDVQSLQNDVDYLSSWSQGALRSLNTDKCVVLRLHPRHASECKPPTRQRRYCGGDAQASPPMRKGQKKRQFNNESHKSIIYVYHTYTF